MKLNRSESKTIESQKRESHNKRDGKKKSPVSYNNYINSPQVGNYSVLGSDYQKQRLISEWKEVCKVIDSVPNG